MGGYSVREAWGTLPDMVEKSTECQNAQRLALLEMLQAMDFRKSGFLDRDEFTKAWETSGGYLGPRGTQQGHGLFLRNVWVTARTSYYEFSSTKTRTPNKHIEKSIVGLNL